jgi:hypothetical protein
MTPRDGRLHQHRGTALVVGLVLLVVLAAVVGSVAKLALVARAQAETAERLAQAEWLASSALDRAAARLIDTTDYSGETWDVPAAALPHPGRVRITVERGDGLQQRARVVARAEYPAGADSFVTSTCAAWVALGVGPEPENFTNTSPRPDAAPEEDR